MDPKIEAVLKNEQELYDRFYNFANTFNVPEFGDFHLMDYAQIQEFSTQILKLQRDAEKEATDCSVHLIFINKLIMDMERVNINTLNNGLKASDVTAFLEQLREYGKMFGKLSGILKEKKDYLSGLIMSLRSIAARVFHLQK